MSGEEKREYGRYVVGHANWWRDEPSCSPRTTGLPKARFTSAERKALSRRSISANVRNRWPQRWRGSDAPVNRAGLTTPQPRQHSDIAQHTSGIGNREKRPGLSTGASISPMGHTNNSWPNRAVGAASVGRSLNNGLASITTMQPAKFGVCSAVAATWASVDSKTILSASGEQSNTSEWRASAANCV